MNQAQQSCIQQMIENGNTVETRAHPDGVLAILRNNHIRLVLNDRALAKAQRRAPSPTMAPRVVTVGPFAICGHHLEACACADCVRFLLPR